MISNHGNFAGALRVIAAFPALALLVFALGAAPAAAHDYRAGTIFIDHPWAPESIGPAPTGAVYMTLINEGAEADRLIGAATPAAAEAPLHSNSVEDGVMRMRSRKAIEVAPGAPLALQPGGALHIMLIGLKAPLKAGARLPLTLTFEKAGPVEVEAVVQKPRDGGHDAADHPHMGM